MPYSTGTWGEEEKKRSQRRKEYFIQYARNQQVKKGNYLDRSTDVENNDTLAVHGEKFALKALIGSYWVGRPYDLSWEGKRIDVKTSSPKKDIQGYERWKFLLTQKGSVDYFLLICLDNDRKVENTYLIPDKEVNAKNITILRNRRSKYSKYGMLLV